MKRWAIVILKSNGFLDCFSVYAKNKKEAKESAEATIFDRFPNSKLVNIFKYNEFWGLTKPY